MTDPFIQALFGAAMKQGWTFVGPQTSSAQGYHQQAQHHQQATDPHPYGSGKRGTWPHYDDAPKPSYVTDPLIAGGYLTPKSVARDSYDRFLREMVRGKRGEPVRLVHYKINDDPDEP